jgi:hypothetical protein
MNQLDIITESDKVTIGKTPILETKIESKKMNRGAWFQLLKQQVERLEKEGKNVLLISI